jgi:hypothetical protein
VEFAFADSRFKASVWADGNCNIPRFGGAVLSGPNPLAAQEAEWLLASDWRCDVLGYPELPVDPLVLAEGFGIRAYVEDLPGGMVSALVAQNDDRIMLLNVSHSRARQRFWAACELGYFIGQGGVDTRADRFTHVAMGSTITPGDSLESYALGFAGGLLMPESWLSRLCYEGVGGVEMAERLSVPVDILAARLADLGPE